MGSTDNTDEQSHENTNSAESVDVENQTDNNCTDNHTNEVPTEISSVESENELKSTNEEISIDSIIPEEALEGASDLKETVEEVTPHVEEETSDEKVITSNEEAPLEKEIISVEVTDEEQAPTEEQSISDEAAGTSIEIEETPNEEKVTYNA